MDIYSWILTLAIISGQLIKIPITSQGGISMLDMTVVIFCIVGLLKLKFTLKKPSLPLTGALLFIFVAILSLVLTPLDLTLPQYFSSFLYTVRFGAYVLLGWEIYSGAYPQLKNQIPQILILSGLSLAILGLAQIIFLPDLRFLARYGWDPHYYRTVSTFLDPNFLGGYLTLTLILLFQSRSMVKKRDIFFFALIYLALLTTFSRSSYGMFLISFLSLAFLKRSVKLALMTIVLFALFLFSFQFYIKGVNKITPLDRNQTANLRFSTWTQGFEIFQKYPILGVGFNAYNFALRQYRLGDEQFLSGKGSTTNDSSLLYILSTTGVLGFIAYFSFIYGLVKSSRSKNLSMMAAIPGLLAHSLFVNSLFYPFILIWIILSSSSSYDNQTIK